MANKTSTSRGSNPSASKIGAIMECRGYHLANQRFPYVGDRSAAEEGTIRHTIEEMEVPLDDIADDERRLCAYKARQAIGFCRETIGIDGEVPAGAGGKDGRL